MIFVTIGQMLPFDRLIRAVDAWAGERRRGDVFAQIGDGRFEPRHMRWQRKLSPTEFTERVRESEAVVTHAGMGTILTAFDLGRPILIMPRRAELREVTNDHQLATARYFAADGRIAVAFDEAELHARLERLGELKPPAHRPSPETERLIATLRHFIAHGALSAPGDG
jgi:UDP-N-acetylglucosamine transferase subunit ALG13